jgi:hypothetical protein
MNNVLCIKWGNKYDSEYVNKLYNMVSRNLSIPFRFICLTDDNSNINPEIEVKPIPKIGFEPFDNMNPWARGNGWLKLTSFINPLYDISGKILFLDLDIVITGELDEFFKYDFPFTVIREWSMNDGTGNTSVYLFRSGEHSDALDEFKMNYQYYLSQHRNEQEYITQYLIKNKKVDYWPSEWCVSFKYHCMGRGLKSWIKKPQIPNGAKIVVFHGEPNPPDAIIGKSPTWYKRVKPTKWVNDLWR